LAGAFGTIAGSVAGLLIAASPAHRAFAVDCMLESGGAFLTLAALAAFQRFSRARTVGAARLLVLFCLANFFWKYNYWLLVTIAMVACEAWSRRGVLRETVPRLAGNWKAIAGSLPRHPLLIVALLVLASGLAVLFRGPTTISLGEWSVTASRHHGIVHVGWVLLCIQAVAWWRATGRAWLGTWDAPDRQVVLGMAIPIGVWFLVPKRLGSFLWFLSPMNSDQTSAEAAERVRRYLVFIESDYFAQPWMAVAAVLLSVVGLPGLRRHRPGIGVLFVFLAIAAVLTADHPMVKS
jgi:hypothetical protein